MFIQQEEAQVDITRMPDVVVMRVVDMLGTPPPQPESKMLPATFLADVTSMAQVCHQWNRIMIVLSALMF